MVNMHLIMENSINLLDNGNSNIRFIPNDKKQKDFYVYYDELQHDKNKVIIQTLI